MCSCKATRAASISLHLLAHVVALLLAFTDERACVHQQKSQARPHLHARSLTPCRGNKLLHCYVLSSLTHSAELLHARA
jgi:hypothetical protein